MGLANKNELNDEKILSIILIRILKYTASTSIILLGFFFNKFLILVGIGLFFTNKKLCNINSLYSILSILYIFHGTYLTNLISFEWTRLYYLMAILIVIYTIIKAMIGEKILRFNRDHYLYIMALILFWGTISALFSLQVVQSLKNILSVFLVFVIFYIIPTYFFNNNEKERHLKYIILPSNMIITSISFINILYYFNLIDAKLIDSNWTINGALYRNSNGYGLTIVTILIIMSVFMSENKKISNYIERISLFKIYVLSSYLILLLNLIISGSRAALLGAIVAFIPKMLKRKLQIIGLIGILGLIFLKANNSLLLLKKISRGTMSGRTKIWIYTFNKVIAKYPFLGIGSGASNDHIGVFGGLSPHNSYLNVTMQIGLIGFMFWILIFGLIFYKSSKLQANKNIYIFAILGFMAFSAFESTLFGGMGQRMSMFWTIVMLIEHNLKIKKHNTGGIQ